MVEGERSGQLPDDLRCKRTDGRQWRCNRRVMDGKKLCEIHHLQGRHRQYRRKVPESLKLKRENRSRNGLSACSDDFALARAGKLQQEKNKKKKRKRKRTESEAVDEAVKKMKLKRGDLQLELIRMVLKRQVEKKRETKKNREKKDKKVAESLKCDSESGEEEEAEEEEEEAEEGAEEEEEELMRDLPNGRMAISSPSKQQHVSNVASSFCNVKIGGADFGAVTRRRFRSKNIEPMPISTLQVVPFKKDVVRLRRGKRKRCHFCRRSESKNLIKCSSCRKEFFCTDCIKDQYSIVEDEVRMACPVCRGTCRCISCSAIQNGDSECKGFSEDTSKVNKVLHFHYLICMLLPVLKQINQDQSIELEIEAKIKGKKPSEIKIQRAEVSCSRQCSCNNCKISIVDFHRSCPNCSYNLCLSCCWDIFQGSLSGTVKGILCKYLNRRKVCISSKKLSGTKSLCTTKQSYRCKSFYSTTLSPSWKAPDVDGGIPCPPVEFGGCGDSILDLSCVFPLSWIKELEVSAEQIVGCYELPETLDVSSDCSLCLGMDCESNGNEQLQQAARREDSNDNLLYSPTIVDLRSDNLEHFQKHWGKGQPVLVRNVLQGTSELSWDPIVMFCTYLKNNAAKSENEQHTDCLDWFEVEIGIKQLFMGSNSKYTNMWDEKLKLKGWLSSHLFQEHFPSHYTEILRGLPLPEYVDPICGVLNVAAELPPEIMKPDLGPFVYISYGSGENLVQADSVAKLRFDTYDVVNILAYASDVPVSAEQLNYIRKLMKKHKEQTRVSGETLLDQKNLEVGLQDIDVEEMHLHKKVARVSWFSATRHEPQVVSRRDRDMYHDGVDDSDSDTDTDTEVSKFFFGPVKSSRTSEYLKSCGKYSNANEHVENKKVPESCGAQWDVFRRKDVPKLVEYLRRHRNEFTHSYGFSNHMIHPILDQNFFLDTSHKMRLKEEYEIEPWTFEQHVGEAVIIPAGCPYQIRNFKSCVNVVLDFISPENVPECIKMIDELRLLPDKHKARADSLEVKKMALHSINRAIREIRELTCTE